MNLCCSRVSRLMKRVHAEKENVNFVMADRFIFLFLLSKKNSPPEKKQSLNSWLPDLLRLYWSVARFGDFDPNSPNNKANASVALR